MKILITGSNGLLGQKLVYNLINDKDVSLVATALGENRLIEKSGYTYESLDITNEDEVKKCISKHKPDVVINTAAMTNVDACETQRELCWKLNVDAVRFLAEACKTNKVHLIHLSTDFIFDGVKGNYCEEDQPNPLSYYAESKLESEKVVKQVGGKWSIARTIIVYGVVDNMSRSNVVLWAKGALEKGQKINVVNDQFRSPTLAEDLAEGCILIAKKGKEGIYHLSGPETMSIFELVQRVADFYHFDKSLITPSDSSTLNQPAKRPPKTGFNISKAVEELGYRPHSFPEGLKILTTQLEKKQ